MPQDFHGVMREWKGGQLHSGSKHGPVVHSQKQAEAIAFSEEKAEGKSDSPAEDRREAKTRPSMAALKRHRG